MSKAADRLRAARIFNPHGAATIASEQGLPDVYVSYRRREDHTLTTPAWQVCRPSAPTDPDAPWYDRHFKTFSVPSTKERAAQLEAALAWASEKYGINEWGQLPGLGATRFPKATVDYIKTLIQDA